MEQVFPAIFAGAFPIFIYLVFAIFGIFSVAAFGFWIWMIVDCAQRPFDESQNNQRLVWILVLVFAGWVGAILYYFVVKMPRDRAGQGGQLPPPN